MRLKLYLVEKTFNIKKDVELIYDKLFADFIAEIKRKEYPPEDIIKGALMKSMGYSRHSMSSDRLTSKSARAAHAIKPIKIHVGVFPSPAYNPKDNKINLTFNPQVLSILRQWGGNVEGGGALKPNELRRFKAETSPNRIKASIAHELSHWMNDVLHNSNIEKVIDLAQEFQDMDILKLGKEDVNMTHFEIDAQIHGIKALKQQHTTTQWNKLTIADMMDLYPPIYGTWEATKQYGKEVNNIWKKLLLKRMAREKILGKNMRAFPKSFIGPF
jgi:hypothetical protein